MAAIRDEEIEAEARAILREAIARSGWYRGGTVNLTLLYALPGV
jgi:plasmid stability protein